MLNAGLQKEAKRIAAEKELLDRVEAQFSTLKSALDAFPSVRLETAMVDVAEKVRQLRAVVNDTLDAASNFLVATDGDASDAGQSAIYDQLLKELTVLDPEAVQAKENREQAEAEAELARKVEIASVADIQVNCGGVDAGVDDEELLANVKVNKLPAMFGMLMGMHGMWF